MEFEILATQKIHQGRVFSLRRDKVRLPGGLEANLDIIDHPPAVTLVPVDEENNLLFVRQYRHAAGIEMLELPAGVVEAGEPPDECAKREIREETKMSAGSIQKIGEFYQAPGYSTEYMYLYLATELKPDPLPGDEDEFITVERIPVAEAYRMAEQGEIIDAKTLAALLLAAPYLKLGKLDLFDC